MTGPGLAGAAVWAEAAVATSEAAAVAAMIRAFMGIPLRTLFCVASLELGGGREAEGFRLVVIFLGKDLGDVEADRTHWRLPVDADAGGSPQRQLVDDIGVGQTAGGRRVAVIEHAQRSDVHEHRGPDAVLFRQAVRDGHLEGADGVEIAAERVVVGAGRKIARADACGLEAAEAVAALEEAVVDADRVAVPAADVAGRTLNADDPGWRDAIVPARISLGLHIVHVAADAGEVLTQGAGPAARRPDRIVGVVHLKRIARRRVDVAADLVAQGRRAAAAGVAIAGRDDDFVGLQEVAHAEGGVRARAHRRAVAGDPGRAARAGHRLCATAAAGAHVRPRPLPARPVPAQPGRRLAALCTRHGRRRRPRRDSGALRRSGPLPGPERGGHRIDPARFPRQPVQQQRRPQRHPRAHRRGQPDHRPVPPVPAVAAAEPTVAIAELTPTIRPCESTNGPPELPGLIAASV